MYILEDVESNTEQTAEEEQGDNNSGFNEHRKENKAAGETPLQGCSYWSWSRFKYYVIVVRYVRKSSTMSGV